MTGYQKEAFRLSAGNNCFVSIDKVGMIASFGRSIVAIGFAILVWMVLTSVEGTAHEFVFGIFNLLLLIYWYVSLKDSFETPMNKLGLPGQTMVAFGSALVMISITMGNDVMYYIPYGLLILLLGVVTCWFGTLDPSVVYAEGGYFDRHPFQSILFSFGLIALVLILVIAFILTLLA
jgi:hypothetical protein